MVGQQLKRTPHTRVSIKPYDTRSVYRGCEFREVCKASREALRNTRREAANLSEEQPPYTSERDEVRFCRMAEMLLDVIGIVNRETQTVLCGFYVEPSRVASSLENKNADSARAGFSQGNLLFQQRFSLLSALARLSVVQLICYTTFLFR